ncbi:MAG TPA: DUF1629 domain-containing protein [Planctomycetota bacterium]|nr:DUF1629 domain-containing protein [Planctomycetota bacterium]
MRSSDLLIWWPKNVRHAASLEPLEGFEDTFDLLDGVPCAKRFPDDALFRMDPELPDDTLLTDNLVNKDRLLVVSEKMKGLLERLKIKKVEYLPVAILDHRDRPVREKYFIAHPVDPVDALDVDASDVEWSLIDDSLIDDVGTLVLDEEQLDPKRQLFRLKSFSRLILVHRAVAEAIDKEGLTGVRWVELSDYPEG